MKIEPLKPDNLEALVRVWNQSALFDQVTSALMAEKIFGDPDHEAELCVVAREPQADGATIVAFAMAVCRPASSRGYIKLLAVHPEWRRQGLATRLLDLLEPLLAERGVTEIRVCESAPNYLTPGVDVRYDAADFLLRKRAYEHFANALNQRVDLIEWANRAGGFDEIAAACEHKVVLRRAELDDTERLDEFLQQHWPAWQDEVHQALANRPVTLFVAAQAARIIGFAAHDANNRGTGWFGPMGTSPECRGLGIGSKLLSLCLADIREQGYESAIIPWVGPVEFYAKHAGARPDREFRRYRKPLRPIDAGGFRAEARSSQRAKV